MEMTETRAPGMVLSQTEETLVASAFEHAKDFRSVGERITAPIDSIIDETANIIESDPILRVSTELEEMNAKMHAVYGEIIDSDSAVSKFLKGIPGVGMLVTKVQSAIGNAAFNMQDVNEKIVTIFSGFDQSYESLNLSIDMQQKFLDGIEANLGKVVAYKDLLEAKLESYKERMRESGEDEEHLKLFMHSVEFFLTNLVVLVGNLEMAKKRLLVRLDSAQKLSLSMNASKPIFKTLLSTAVIEISGQKAIDASLEAMNAMSASIDKMSADLTDKAIEGNRRAEATSSKPVLSNAVFIDNVTKLKNHFEEIDGYRQRVSEEAKKEREEFDTARQQLEDIKVLTKKESDALERMLVE